MKGSQVCITLPGYTHLMSFTSTANGTGLSAHGARVAPSGRPLGGANL
jgi:hypothetical protein